MASLVIIMGPTGAGKSVQSELLAQAYGWTHIASGNLLRAQPDIAARLVSGDLAPAHEVERLVGNALRSAQPNQVVILDGFPRVLEQAKWLDKHLTDWALTILTIIHLDITRTTSECRLAQRHRADDLASALERKWQAYQDRTIPVMRYYESRGLLKRVDANGSVEEVYERITQVFS